MTSFDQVRIYNFSGITFQNAETNPSQQYTLTGGQSLSTESLGFVITATITGADLLQLKHRIGLATFISDTYIAAAVGITVASDGQPILPAVAQARSFIGD